MLTKLFLGGSMNTVRRSCGIIAFLVVTIINGAEIYVAPTGNDAAAGTVTAPLATITAARDKADLLKAGNTPVTVYFRGGTYYLTAPVTFATANSGTATAPIVYAAYPGEKPVISGGIKVTTAWSTYAGQIMVTTIATGLKVDQLFLNGKRQVMARYPNFNANQVILDGYASDCISATRVSRWANPAEGPGYFRAIHSAAWGGNDYIMTGKTGTTLNYTWVGDNNRGNQPHATYRMVENLFEELDTAGEWYYRKSTGQLFFWPPAGTTLSSSTVELASLDQLLQFQGSAAGSATSVKYIQINGLTFTHAYRTLFSKTYETVLQSDWAIARAGAVFLQNAENIVIENCLFDQVGGNGVFVSGYNRNHVVYNNVFNDGGASCVCLFGLTSSVRCPSSWSSTPACADKTPGPVDPVNGEFPAYVRVDNNMMNHFGRFEKQPAGVAMSATECDTIRHNTIRNCPRAGICFCDGCWGGTVVEYNWVYNTVQETGDHGPFNAWGRDRNMQWTNDTNATTFDSWKTTIVRNNRLEPKPGDFSLDMDDDASNYYSCNNLVFGGGIKFIGTMRKDSYVNNIFLRNAQVLIFGGQISTTSGYYMTRNSIDNSQPYALASNTPAYFKQNTRMVDSNFYSSSTTQICGDQCYSWAQWQAAGLDAHSLRVTPTFADTAKVFPNNYAPQGDFSITSSALLSLGFKNFPMDSFGVMPLPPTGTNHLFQDRVDKKDNGRAIIHYTAGKLVISCVGDFHATVSNALGRKIEMFNGNGISHFAVSQGTFAKGVYFVSVHSKGYVITGKIIEE